MIIGIDLGTTFSVLAVRGRVGLAEGYPPPSYLAELDITIIPDPYGNDVIPSAVWEDPDNPGTLVVGAEARDRVADGQAPILFSKRNIGTDIIHRLGEREYSAREVAAIILRYLKDIAEQALDERVDRAVITHPAFFEGAMMRETAEAAVDAGFDFDQDRHLMMEPTAAALAYTGTDPRDPLRLLTYDLGGGTFDVTVVERRGGVVTVKAFGGNRLLGGYSFDRRLANWLYEQMRERGFRITVDEDDPRHRATWTRLLQIAENVKLKLTDARTDRMPVNIREQLTDDDGRPVTLLASITRAQYVGLIQDLLDDTIDGHGGAGETKGCEMILAEAALTVDQIDEILLVGGSTWGPWVAETIQRKWGREPRLLEPDRIVAAGAAIQASSLPAEAIRVHGYTVHLDVEPRSPQESITIAGHARVAADRDRSAAALPLAVTLTGQDGSRYVATPDEAGRFLFEDVVLRPLAVSKFTLAVGEGEHHNLTEHHFEVEQVAADAEESGTVTAPLTVLPKPLFIEVADGMEPLADEGATLPTRRTVEFRRIHEFDTIEIRLFQEHDLIGSVLIKEVPPEAVRGSRVQLTVEISRSNKIEGSATVRTPGGTVIREVSVDIAIPRMEVPPLRELGDWQATLESELEERLALEPDASTRMTMRAEGDRLRQKVHRLTDSPVPDRQEAWLLLRQLDRVVHPPREELNPPLADFESLLLDIRDLLAARSSGDPNLQALATITNRLDKEGRAAYARREARRWAQAYDGLLNVFRNLRPTGRPPVDSHELPPAELQKMTAIMRLDQLRQQLRAKEAELMDNVGFDHLRSRADHIRLAIDDLQGTVEKIDNDTDPGAASARIKLVTYKIDPISEDIRLLNFDIGN
jgi:molecular chaperone DnaK (HSP70)